MLLLSPFRFILSFPNHSIYLLLREKTQVGFHVSQIGWHVEQTL